MKVEIQNVSKNYGEGKVLDGLSLTVGSGELFFLLGSSGSGKSTLLRILAGLLKADSGRLLFDGRDVTDLSAEKRQIGLVFQNYALWPHMTVFENVAFGLEARHEPSQTVREKVMKVLSEVRLEGLEKRRPGELSGGQQQRVALARALVIEPGLVLLDEPLSNLDAGLRLEMRSELRRLHRESGATMIYVTHDQKEALSMADRIAILHNGRLEQVGDPEEVYDRPRTSYVAGFIGESNFLPARLVSLAEGQARLEVPWGELTVPQSHCFAAEPGAAKISVRPESLVLAGENEKWLFEAKVLERNFLGDQTQLVLEAFGQRLQLSAQKEGMRPKAGQTVKISLQGLSPTAYGA